MINLLPPEEKRQLHAARSNTLLVRYNILLLGVVIFMLLAIGFVYIYLSNAKNNSQVVIDENTTKVSSFAPIAEQASTFRSNLATAKQILDREVVYSKVIVEVARLMPRGTVLDNLSLDAATFGKPATIAAKAKTYNDAIALKDAFSKSDLFSDVHFESITANDGDASGYRMLVNLSVTIKKDATK